MVPFRMSFLKLLDNKLGGRIARCLPAARIQGGARKSILLIRPGGIGDAVLLAPVLSSLKEAFPDTPIDILAEQRNMAVFEMCPEVNRIYCYDNLASLLNVLRQRYGAVIDTEQWYRLSAVMARLIRSGLKIGFSTNERRRLFTHCVEYSLKDYEVDSFLHLLKPLGINTSSVGYGVWLSVPAPACNKAADVLAPLSRKPLVSIFPGASVPEKQWPENKFRQVVQSCLDEDCSVAIVGGSRERESGAHIATGKDVLNLAGSTSLIETSAILKRSALVLSGDSGVLHLAAALGRPTVSLFGPSCVDKWAPRGSKHIVVRACLSCSPCSKFGTTPPCPNDTCCMQKITVGEVMSAIKSLLSND